MKDGDPGGRSRRRIGPIGVTAILAVAVAAGLSAYERIGTVANADTFETDLDGSSGFLGVGYSPDQPGFVLLSRLDAEAIEVRVQQSVNWLTGTHTVVSLQTPKGVSRFRLRGPLAITVDEQGAVASTLVDWTLADFDAIRKAADCSVADPKELKFCGRPFFYMKEALAKRPIGPVPPLVAQFLKGEQLDHRLVDWFSEHPEAIDHHDHHHEHYHEHYHDDE